MQLRAPRPGSSAAGLRRELSARNLSRAAGFKHEVSYGSVPNIVYQATEGTHGNFLQASYRSICADSEWRKRLTKSYSGSRQIARSWERTRCELDCANSSDALLMNIFCFPGLLSRPVTCTLLGVEPGLRPVFGFKPRLPFANGRTDQTEIDLMLGHLLVEAKLTESGFQTASVERLLRYRELTEVFDVDDLPIIEDKVQSYQLIRGVLAAHSLGRSFLVLCDERRQDLTERWFQVMRAVREGSLRSRLAILTWQELSNTLPHSLRMFVGKKYGIYSPAVRSVRS